MVLCSFIVPARNIENFIAATLRSMEAQTLADFEAIVVDDGSDDATADIVAAAARRDARFRLILGDGAGPGPARNRGLELACGEFIAFVDADDLIHPRYIEVVSGVQQRLGSNDLVVIPYRRGTEVHWATDIATTASPLAHRQVAAGGKAVWRLGARRDFFNRFGIRFPAIRNYEDAVVTTAMMVHTNRFVRLNSPLYFWRQLPGSLIKRRAPERVADALTAVGILTDLRDAAKGRELQRLIDLARIKVIVGQHRLLPAADQRHFVESALSRTDLSRTEAIHQAVRLCALSRGQWLGPTLRFSANAATRAGGGAKPPRGWSSEQRHS